MRKNNIYLPLLAQLSAILRSELLFSYTTLHIKTIVPTNRLKNSKY